MDRVEQRAHHNLRVICTHVCQCFFEHLVGQQAAVNDRRDVVSILDVVPDGKISTGNDSPSQDRYVGIVTEWLDGETLDRLLIRRGEVLPVEQALRQLGIISNTLMHAHSLNVFHRRLRPHNVIFSQGQEDD